jgi:hypothetical protein
MAVEEDKGEAAGRGPWCLVAALAVATVVWVVLFIFRVQAHQPDVDDYLYAFTARGLLHSANPISAVLHTGQTSPLVPAMAALGVGVGGLYGAVAVELPLLLLLVAGSFVLARVWVSPTVAMVIALAAGLNVETLRYEMLLNFAIASSAATIWCFAAYLRSDHLRNWRWAFTFGIAVAALALSRSVAPVYVAPLLLVVAGDYILDVRRNGDFWRNPALLATASLLVLAGPWWLVSGHVALHYLLNAGYNPSSGYLVVPHGFVLTPAAVKLRIIFELTDLGWFESFVLGAAALAAVVVAVLRRRRLNRRSLWMLLLWSVLATLLLSTSSNLGTAFGLPVVVVVIVLCGSVLGQLHTPVLRWAVVPLAVVVVVGVAFQFTSSIGKWWPGPAYRFQVINAGGTIHTDVGLITAEVADAIRGHRTVLARNDAIVNVNGLTWQLGTSSSLLIPPQNQTSTAAAIRDLSRASALIAGTTQASYYGSLNQSAVQKAAFDDGYRPYQVWTVGKYNSIIVWRRGLGRSVVRLLPPETSVLQPSSGTVVKGKHYLVAQASDVIGVTSVKFEISGGTPRHELVITAGPFPYGWLGGWDTTALPNGVYTIHSVAENVEGQSTRSAPVVVRVDNGRSHVQPGSIQSGR